MAQKHTKTEQARKYIKGLIDKSSLPTMSFNGISSLLPGVPQHIIWGVIADFEKDGTLFRQGHLYHIIARTKMKEVLGTAYILRKNQTWRPERVSVTVPESVAYDEQTLTMLEGRGNELYGGSALEVFVKRGWRSVEVL